MTGTYSSEKEIINLSGQGLLFVDVSNDVFGIPIEHVKEVIELAKITPVPMCPPSISGVINVRGSVVPVMDASTRLGLSQSVNYDRYSCIVLYHYLDPKTEDETTLGFVVSRVRSIELMGENSTVAPPAFGSHIPAEFMWQMIKVGSDLLPILDMAQVLNVDQVNHDLKQFQSALLAKWE